MIDFDIYVTIIAIFFLVLFGTDVVRTVQWVKKKRDPSQVIVVRSFKEKLKRFFTNKLLLAHILFIVVTAVAGYLLYFKTQPKILSSYPATEGVWESYSRPLEVTFNMPVSTLRLRPSINPEIKGHWEWDSYLGVIDFMTRSGRYIPEETQYADQRIVVYITGIGRIGIEENHEFGFVFDTVPYPELTYTDPFNKTTDVKQDKDIILHLNRKNENLVDFIYQFTPAVNFTAENLGDYAIKLKLNEQLKQSQEYRLAILRKPKRINIASGAVLESDNAELIHEITFTTIKEPLVKSFTPKGTGIREDSTIRIKFQVQMDRPTVESSLLITPALDVAKTWEDNKILILTPVKPLPKETKYTVTLKQGIKSLYGGISTKDLSFEFETIGAIRVSKFEPAANQIKVNEGSNIKITFDQEVDHASAQSHFQITGGVNGDFSWEGNSMIFNPNNNLQFNTSYTITLTPGIKTVYGLDSRDTFTSNFSTRAFQVIISMPWYPQPQPSDSCNIYAAKMALAWKGYQVSASGIISEIGYNPNRVNNQWAGDPYTQYVGYSDGSWGYGVYWDALRKVFTNRGITTDLHQGWNIRDLAKSIEDGHPVIIWRYNGESANYDFGWTASNGRYVNAISGQHGGVITGYTGTSDNPTAFYVNDPWYGLIWINASSFDYYWSRLGRVGLVIY